MKSIVLFLLVCVAIGCTHKSKDLNSKQTKDFEKNYITKKDVDLKTILEAWSNSFIGKVDSN